MAGTVDLGAPWLLGNPAAPTPAQTLRQIIAALFLPPSGDAGVQVQGGLLPGTAGNRGELTVTSPTNLRVNPFQAVVQGSLSTLQGAYLVPNGTQRNLTITGRDGSQWRRALLLVEVLDSAAAGTPGSGDVARLSLLDGGLGSTSAVALPAAPANSLAVGEVLIPPTSASGSSVTVTPYTIPTSLRGGVLVVEEEHTKTQFVRWRGQVRHHPSRGLQVVSAAGEYETVAVRQAHLGSDTGADGTATVDAAIINMDIVVPADLPPGRRIRYSGDVFVVCPAGVQPKLSFQGGLGARQISRNSGFDTDMHVEYFDTNLTPGYRQVQLRLDAVGGSIDYYDPRLHATIV